MARDLMIDQSGDFVIDPNTHDLEVVEGADEIAQRIRATLDIYYGEMDNLDSEIGSDYSNMLGKQPDLEHATDDMEAAITAQVPEIQTVDSITFTKDKNRHLIVDFEVTYLDEDDNEQQAKGGYDIGT
ncbi:DUF2634 domain-containing protein [Lentilactobacillus buchneri]|mgnify:FL=1|jgi:hypothetical protein|uniref:DUF2634 domain-containing protein n=1 Tax=Lentilactobacillus buchneri DSM 20057 TaxID=1423728 RepID=A0A4V3A429_LENBU|nr:hypothetical protein [Lentilactobacillus buchneri]DAI96101.1 MAG TPA: Protein of unknown function (DUF2634) [Caudoviricetes sp.]MCT3253513.1 DUF2634 domain-containing protein [Lentilactobacillus buchneri]MCT3548104.1 DUF2634 domain-containing protein [Lentilactobacillus buchneri]MCT4438572.1 DUF2634 domain-containing protein [Lentilactobacillus buchneri]MQM69509.1 DUF2634 domain-containing protein [Lentilactobacillus buchneri]